MSDTGYEITQLEIRVLLRRYWKKGLTIRDAADAINKIEGEKTIGKTAAGKWFKRFNEGDFDLEDRPRSGRPTVLDESDLQAALDAEPSSSTRDLEAELGVSHMTVWNHLQKLDFVHKKPRQDPHELTEAQANKRVEVCRQLLNNPLDDRFWKRIVTSDEKWLYLVNHNRDKRRRQFQSKIGLAKKSCFVFGGTSRGLFTLNWFRTAAPSMPSFIVSSWNASTTSLRRSTRLW